MSTTILLALLVCIVGGLVYLIIGPGTPRARVAQLALYAFATGLLATLLMVGGHVIKL